MHIAIINDELAAVRCGEAHGTAAIGLEAFGNTVEDGKEPVVDVIDVVGVFLLFRWLAINAAVGGKSDSGNAIVIDADRLRQI